MLTVNPAAILGKEDQFGRLKKGMDANFLVTKGIPGLGITNIKTIKRVYFKGELCCESG